MLNYMLDDSNVFFFSFNNSTEADMIFKHSLKLKHPHGLVDAKPLNVCLSYKMSYKHTKRKNDFTRQIVMENVFQK